MTEWLIAVAAIGIWFGVFHLEKIARSAAKVEKDLAGLRYQVEQLQARGADISSDLHAIKGHTNKVGRTIDDARVAAVIGELADRIL